MSAQITVKPVLVELKDDPVWRVECVDHTFAPTIKVEITAHKNSHLMSQFRDDDGAPVFDPVKVVINP